MLSHLHKKNQWMFSYRFMTMQMNEVLDGTQKIAKEDLFVNYLAVPDKMSMNMHMLMAMYGLSSKITLMTMLNFNQYAMNMSMLGGTGPHQHPGSAEHGGSGHNMQAAGFGDVKLSALFGLINERQQQFFVSAGLSIPTGSIHVQGGDESMYSGQRLPYNMQMGSGTVDFLPCINYLYQKNKISYSLQASGSIRSYYNAVGYKLGNECTVNAWFGYQWADFLSSTVRLEGTAGSAIKGNDLTLYYNNEPAANPHNYGGQRASVFAGTSFHVKRGCFKKSKVSVEYGLPFFQSLNGPQMGQKSGLFVSASFTL
jgi:hypothetical protein